MATRSTLFDPVKGTRVAVESGSQDAQNLFARGFKLETPEQNFKTYSASAPKQIVQQEGGRQLYAQDAGAGTQTYIKSPDQLSGLIGQGYMDTRAPINFQGGGAPAPAPTAPAPSPAPQAPAAPAVNPADSFNASVMALLKGNRGGDEDLLAKRNEIIQARFNTVQASPEGNAALLTPDAQRGMRSMEVSGLETQLSGVNTALQGRERQREAFSQQLRDTLDVIKEQASVTKSDSGEMGRIRDDARASLQFAISNSPDSIRELGDAEKRDWEKQAGYPSGFLNSFGTTQTLKEQALTIKKEDAERKGFQFVSGTRTQPAGYFDRDTQKFYTLSGAAPAVAGAGGTVKKSSGGGGGTALPKGTYDSQLSQLNASKGSDGFVNTDVYKRLRSSLKSTYQGSFDKNFSYMLNPNDQSAQLLLGKKAPTSTGATRYTSKNIPSDLRGELTTNIGAGASKVKLYAAYPDIDSAYIDQLYKSINE